MSVTYPLPATDETVYHVSIGSRTIGLCWQAMVDSHGRVAETGSAAELAAGSDSAAAVYCREQGYVYEVRTQPNGTRCGVCAFPDGSVCSSWAFLRGQCQPGDQPAEGN
jgi:putative hemolysin